MTWIPAKTPPDADRTVIVHCPKESEPCWLGYLDSDGWRSVEGMPIKVKHWQELPEPPAKKKVRR